MVNECSRKDCQNILCDTYLDGFGYVCGSCQNDFEELIDKKYDDSVELTKSILSKDFKEFMKTSKEDSDNTPMTVNKFFNRESDE